MTPTDAKPDAFSLEGLIAWLETMPADGAYNYLDTCECMVAQYLTSQGLGPLMVGSRSFNVRIDRDDYGPNIEFPPAFNRIANPRGDQPHTFGAALDRARKALAA